MNYKLESTKNYQLFDLHHINREVDKTSKHYKDLYDSMKTFGFIPACPLHCEKNGKEKLKIKQGHHRFACAMELELPVYYIVSDDTASIHNLEIPNCPWDKNDYLASYSKAGNENYIMLEAFMKRTGIGLAAAASMFFGEAAGSGNVMKNSRFESGEFFIKQAVHANAVADVVNFLRHRIGLTYASSRALVSAISRLMFVKEFKVQEFKEKAVKYPFLFTRQRGFKEYTAMIEEIYNYRTPAKSKVSLSFLANKVADTRNAIKNKS